MPQDRAEEIARSARVLLILKRKLPWQLHAEDTQRSVLENLVHIDWRSCALVADQSGAGATGNLKSVVLTANSRLAHCVDQSWGAPFGPVANQHRVPAFLVAVECPCTRQAAQSTDTCPGQGP